MDEVEYLIAGGGPTGLGAAHKLMEHDREWMLCEGANQFGGLAASVLDENGYTWDLGGHVLFSHYDEFDRFMIQALGEDGWFHHRRESWVWIRNRFVPYPFQYNLHRLDPADCWECVRGLLEVEHALADDRAEVRNFRDWIYRTFGTGIAELFMLPYNRKVWAKPLEAMDYTWIAERVAVPSLEEVLHGVCTGTDHISWGPNRHFRFPRRGGTGAIWTALGRQLPQHQCRLNAVLEHINVPARIARLGDGTKIKYGKLISTLPLDELVEMDDGLKEMPGRELISSGTHVTGFGFEGAPPDRLRTKCWMYFPEQNSPYYRVTVFSNYSYFNVPQDKPRWSLMAETSVDSSRPVDKEALIDWTLRAMREDHLIPDTLQADTVFHHHLPKAYPTPYTGRNQAVDPLLQHLEARNIYSRGRFGAWKYETGNMDHCFMQGYECAERLVLSAGREREPTLFSSC